MRLSGVLSQAKIDNNDLLSVSPQKTGRDKTGLSTTALSKRPDTHASLFGGRIHRTGNDQ
jgi:hypothetical protein